MACWWYNKAITWTKVDYWLVTPCESNFLASTQANILYSWMSYTIKIITIATSPQGPGQLYSDRILD